MAETSSRDRDKLVRLFRFLIPKPFKIKRNGVQKQNMEKTSAKRNMIAWPVRRRTLGEIVRESATVLGRRRSQHVWVGYGQGEVVQETRWSGRCCGDIYFDEGAIQ